MDTINLSLFSMFLVILMPIIISFILYIKNYQISKSIIITTIKMIIQLLIAGYILIYIFKVENPYLTIAYIFVMVIFAGNIIRRRFNKLLDININSIHVAIALSSLLVLSYIICIIIKPDNPFDPQYIISLYGMLLGNTITAGVLCINTYGLNLKANNQQINSLINMGVHPKKALSNVSKSAVTTAITPILTSMTGIGLVSLPGMMTGQILGGVAPLIAIKYQILVMSSILTSSTITILLITWYFTRALVNQYDQLDIHYVDMR